MLTVTVCVNLPRSIVTDHYLLDQIYVEHEELRFGPANIICWTLTSDNLLGLLPGLLK